VDAGPTVATDPVDATELSRTLDELTGPA
jgi:hypothetical protein